MKTNLRQLFAQLEAMPRYVAEANKLSVERATEICALFGEDFACVQREFDGANAYFGQVLKQGDLRGNGAGMHSNAERLFFGYIYDLHYMAACDDASEAKHA